MAFLKRRRLLIRVIKERVVVFQGIMSKTLVLMATRTYITILMGRKGKFKTHKSNK